VDDPESALPPADLGVDLRHVTGAERAFSLALPFAYTAVYFFCAWRGWWIPAVLAVMGLSFVTYGSTSHDLVHGTLGLSRRANDWLLSIIELLTLRSGHAYKAAHLHHHAHYPEVDDLEGRAARLSLVGALLEGPRYAASLWTWAFRRSERDRAWIVGEGILCVLLLGAAAVSTAWTPVFAVYAALVVMGSWVFPVITAYVPHDPTAKDVLFQTRVFRGRVARTIAFEHLYHLEHHLYPSVPHHHWKTLALRLDPYLARAGVRPIKLLF
jgi:beta-carotene hydroxylase